MCFARRDLHRWLAKEALAQRSQVATGSSRDIPLLIRKVGREPGVGQRSPSCGCSHSCHDLDRTSWRHSWVGHGKFTAANAPAGKGEEHGDGGEVHWGSAKAGSGRTEV